MPKYMLIYKGEATDPADMDPAEVQEVMGKWAAWMEGVGSALVDMGTPLAPAASLVDDGSSGAPTPVNGYSILEAADVSEARNLTKGHPYLSEGKGNFAIDIHEVLPLPSMG